MSLDELIQACAEGNDPAAWEEFIRRFHPLIASVVRRTARRWGNDSPELVDDLIQEAFLKIYGGRRRVLSGFKPHHPEAFSGFLAVITANLVNDYFRTRHSQKHGSGQPEGSIDDSPAVADAAATNRPAEHVFRNLQIGEVERALSSCVGGAEPERDLTIFWLYYKEGVSAAAIARLPSILLNVKGVESVIHRLTRCVRERLCGEH
ncbi:MAG: sigma-70 family RNA polymerase sigma factor [Candidatus Sulfotelmatobacter sp.]|jgi:RNA polymerase sigma-70 factor (ECF subfamily)